MPRHCGRHGLALLVCVPLAVLVPLAALGEDTIPVRKLLVFAPAVAVLLGVGVATLSDRMQAVLVAVLAAGFVGNFAWVQVDDDLQREDWRAVAASLRGGPLPRLVVTTPADDSLPLRPYLEGIARAPSTSVRVREVVVLSLPVLSDTKSQFTAAPIKPRLGPDLRLSGIERRDSFVLARYRVRTRVVERPRALLAYRLDHRQIGSVLLQHESGRKVASEESEFACD
jgi:hypothetical protein